MDLESPMTTALVPVNDKLDVVLFARPITSARTFHSLTYGATVLEILRELGSARTSRLVIDLDGEYVPRALWGAKRPRPGQVLHIGVMLLGSGGGQGQDSNKALRTT